MAEPFRSVAPPPDELLQLVPDLGPVVDDLDSDAELVELGLDAGRLDAELAELEADDLTGDLGALLEPPAGMADRVAAAAEARLLERDRLLAFGELLGLGWQTSRLLLDPDPDGDERPRGT